MKIKLKKAIIPVLAFSTFLILGIIFDSLDHESQHIHLLVTPLDRMTPFIPIFIIPYVFWFVYIYIVLALILWKSSKKYYQTVVYYNVGQIICFFCYHFYRTTVPRPNVTGHDIFSRLVTKVYVNDLPYNCFPSIHVLTTFIFMLMFWRIKTKRWLWWSVEIIGFFIIISTLFVKQHVLLDVVAGIGVVLLMHIAWNVVEKLLNQKRYLAKKDSSYLNY